MTAKRRLVLIGLDAADREFIATHRADLPNISRIVDGGIGGALAAEPMSGAVWPTFSARSGPGEHGIYHHLQWDPAEMRMRRATGNWLPYRPFWRDLGARGTRVIAFDVPFVFPGPAPNVLEVMNWGSHDLIGPYWVNDSSLAKAIHAMFDQHPMGIEIPVPKTRPQLTHILSNLVKGAAHKARLVTWLMRERPWDLFLVVFGEAHRGGHILWKNPNEDQESQVPPNALKQVYIAVDEAVGVIVREGGPDTDFVVFALHGMTSNSAQSHLMPIFMRRAIAYFRGETAPEERGETPGLVRALRRAVPARLQHAIGVAVPQWVRDAVVAREIVGGLRWRDTLGFTLQGDLPGLLRFNLQGREAEGACSNEDAIALTDFIGSELGVLRRADGRALVGGVYFPSREWSGGQAHLLPDILVEWDAQVEPAEEVSSPTLGVIRASSRTGRGGNHRFNGFYAHRGPRQGQGPRPRHVKDLGALVEALV